MFTTDGSKMYYQISQDCGRYKKIGEDGLDALDKDIWRAGESSELVLEKWKLLTSIVDIYVKKLYKTGIIDTINKNNGKPIESLV
jgi:hypothetical protein